MSNGFRRCTGRDIKSLSNSAYYVYRMVTSPKNEHNEKVRRDIQHLAWRPEAY
jgi:hypothetical protein